MGTSAHDFSTPFCSPPENTVVLTQGGAERVDSGYAPSKRTSYDYRESGKFESPWIV